MDTDPLVIRMWMVKSAEIVPCLFVRSTYLQGQWIAARNIYQLQYYSCTISPLMVMSELCLVRIIESRRAILSHWNSHGLVCLSKFLLGNEDTLWMLNMLRYSANRPLWWYNWFRITPCLHWETWKKGLLTSYRSSPLKSPAFNEIYPMVH